MKKSFVLWVVLYYIFVVQSILVGYLWSLNNFYYLAILNFVFLAVLNIVVYFLPEEKKSSDKIIEQDKSYVFSKILHKYGFVLVTILFFGLVLESVFGEFFGFNIWWVVVMYGVFFVFMAQDLFRRKIYFGSKLFLPKDFMFILSLVVGLLIYSVLDLSTILFSVKIFIALIFALLSFVLGVWIFGAIGSFSVWRLLTTRFYIVMVGVIGIFSLTQFSFLVSNSQMISGTKQFFDFALQNIQRNSRLIYNNIVGIEFVNENLVDGFEDLGNEELNSGFVETGKVISGFVDLFDFTGNSESKTGIMNSVISGDSLTGEKITTGELLKVGNSVKLRNSVLYSDGDPLQYDDVLVYLLESLSIELVYTKNIVFVYVPYNSLDYVYFRTAYEKKLIGKNLKPDSVVKCDNYFVMKGILENRDVSSYQGDIFAKYIKKAEDLGVLNGCYLGKYLTKSNI